MRIATDAASVAMPPLRRPRQATKDYDAAAVLCAFNTWAFKREQPSDTLLLQHFVARQTAEAHPVKFILYWGRGTRTTSAKPDTDCLDYLRSFATRIEAVYAPGADLTLCLTDTHAALNGHDAAETDRYFGSIADLANERGMACVRLGDLVDRHAGVTQPAPADDALIEALSRSAAKWYRGPGHPEAGARRYLAMNLIEKQAVQAHAPDSVFITFNGRAFRRLFPDGLPIFYMYSMRRGTALKPWFIDADGHPIEAMA